MRVFNLLASRLCRKGVLRLLLPSRTLAPSAPLLSVLARLHSGISASAHGNPPGSMRSRGVEYKSGLFA